MRKSIKVHFLNSGGNWRNPKYLQTGIFLLFGNIMAIKKFQSRIRELQGE